MKRDMDLVRDILLAVEASDKSPLAWTDVKIDNYSKDAISYHIQLMDESGLLVAQDLCTLGPDGYNFSPKRLTWYGHEFLDSIRDPEIWRQTKEGAKSVGGAGIEIMWEIAKGYAKHLAKEKLGLELG